MEDSYIARCCIGGRSYSNSKSLDSDGSILMKWIRGVIYIVWFPDLGFQSVVSRGALGNKSGSFCEAVNCERSEQEGKFPFAMLVSISCFPFIGFI